MVVVVVVAVVVLGWLGAFFRRGGRCYLCVSMTVNKSIKRIKMPLLSNGIWSGNSHITESKYYVLTVSFIFSPTLLITGRYFAHWKDSQFSFHKWFSLEKKTLTAWIYFSFLSYSCRLPYKLKVSYSSIEVSYPARVFWLCH